MLTILAFVIGLGILIGVHEYGHFRMALACGVRVIRFSVGFGRPLLQWTSKASGTEYVLAFIPLGGYVRMLDERDAPVALHERHLAFNNQRLRNRALIVFAGPAANFLLAIFLYAGVGWAGVNEPQAIVATPVAGSLAHIAGIKGGERVWAAAFDGGNPEEIESFEHLRWMLAQAALKEQDVHLTVAMQDAELVRSEVVLPLSRLGGADAGNQLMQQIGLLAPWTSPSVGKILPGGAAEAAGLAPGDLVLSVDGVPVSDGQLLRSTIRQSIDQNGNTRTQDWLVNREGRNLHILVTPQAESVEGVWMGRIGAYIGHPPEMVLVRKGPVEGLVAAIVKTWDVSILSFQMMGKMLIGEASLQNLSGPLTIADYAGKSASMGLTSYLLFLALISVSLGVLNLLPLPVLDGGHLLYYLCEAITGRPVPEVWQNRLQRGGVVILMGMMSIALFNDVVRIAG